MNEDFPRVSKTWAATNRDAVTAGMEHAATQPQSETHAALPVLSIVRLGLAAFATGARTIPLGDNGTLLRDLAGRGAH